MIALLAPLVRGSTYRRGVHLLLGGVILLPYILLGVVFAQMLGDASLPQYGVLLLLAVSLLIAITPAFLNGTRAVEIAAARGLLDVDLPEPTARADRETTLRSALWYALHLGFGGLVGFGLFTALPMALIFVTQWFGVSREEVEQVTPALLAGLSPVWLSVMGVVLLVAIVYGVAGLGALAAIVAPALLGPSQQERIATLEARAGQLVERNRLARELHDSVGHALTVTTIQAAAARRALDDPEFVRKALVAIEETGRAAMEDLDHVLGLLRDVETDRKAPQRTLDDVEKIVADVTGAGLTVELVREGPLSMLPLAVSREGYRIVQEALTNAVRHAGPVPVTVRIAVAARALDIEVVNAVPAPRRPDSSGRGLAGIRERVEVLGGRVRAGQEEGRWRVAVRLPAGGGS